MLKFRLISLLVLVTAVCIGAFLLRPAKHPPEVQKILAKTPSVLDRSYIEALAVLFNEEIPECSYYVPDLHSKNNSYYEFEIGTEYRLVFFLESKNEIKHLSVYSWDEKENQWNSISKHMTDSNIPPWWYSPENMWIQAERYNGLYSSTSPEHRFFSPK